jgi:hypothetical protein
LKLLRGLAREEIRALVAKGELPAVVRMVAEKMVAEVSALRSPSR